jgi:hypothetical protein
MSARDTHLDSLVVPSGAGVILPPLAITPAPA